MEQRMVDLAGAKNLFAAGVIREFVFVRVPLTDNDWMLEMVAGGGRTYLMMSKRCSGKVYADLYTAVKDAQRVAGREVINLSWKP